MVPRLDYLNGTAGQGMSGARRTMQDVNITRIRRLSERLDDAIELSTRAIKEIQAGRLSDANTNKLKGVWKREREIKHLGKGGSQRADLVLHPKYGKVVRKNAISGVIEPGSVSVGARRIKAMQGKLGHNAGFASVHSIKPNGISYHEYIPGKTRQRKKMAQFLRNEHNANKNLPGENARKRERRAYTALKKLSNRELRPTTAQKELVDAFDKRGYIVHDLMPRNVIGDKVVDAEVFPLRRVNRRKADDPRKMGRPGDYPHYRVFKKR